MILFCWNLKCPIVMPLNSWVSRAGFPLAIIFARSDILLFFQSPHFQLSGTNCSNTKEYICFARKISLVENLRRNKLEFKFQQQLDFIGSTFLDTQYSVSRKTARFCNSTQINLYLYSLETFASHQRIETKRL